MGLHVTWLVERMNWLLARYVSSLKISGFSILSSFAILRSPRRWLSIAIPVIAWKTHFSLVLIKLFQQEFYYEQRWDLQAQSVYSPPWLLQWVWWFTELPGLQLDHKPCRCVWDRKEAAHHLWTVPLNILNNSPTMYPLSPYCDTPTKMSSSGISISLTWFWAFFCDTDQQ